MPDSPRPPAAVDPVEARLVAAGQFLAGCWHLAGLAVRFVEARFRLLLVCAFGAVYAGAPPRTQLTLWGLATALTVLRWSRS